MRGVTDKQASFAQYRSMEGKTLLERYLAVTTELANLYYELSMVRSQEREVKLGTWIDLINRGTSQREADKRADFAALQYTTEFWDVTADIDRRMLEKDVLERVMVERHISCP